MLKILLWEKEKSSDNIALHQFDKGRNCELTPKEIITQKKREGLVSL